ncbi:MAG: peptidylprolyl isomerase [Deltaproteobacteria bacterium]|nr:peptidylprolyl isomerase [Deltaproteobacteria bacterium]
MADKTSTFKQKIQTYGLWLVVGPLVVVFALQFGGPQAQGCSSGGSSLAARVYGANISIGDLQAAYLLAGIDNMPAQQVEQFGLKVNVFNGLIERSLLAREARKIGFDISEDEVLQSVAEDGTVYLSMSVEAPPFLRSGARRFDFSDKDGRFDMDNLRRFIQYRLRRSINEFSQAQIEETLAQRMRDVLTASVQVGPEEVWDAYVRERDRVVLKYARFSPAYYQDLLEPSEREVTDWLAANEKAVEAEYEQNRSRYIALEKQVRARHILIKVEADAELEAKEEARAKANALLAQLKAGADFSLLAREHSQDKGSARRGGDLGYNPRGRMVAPFDEAQFSLQPGEISNPVETNYGFHIIKVESIREGDVPEEEAKREIAERTLRESRGKERAREAAESMLARLKQGTTMETVEAEFAGRPAEQTVDADESEAEAEQDEQDPLAPQVRTTQAFSRTDTAIYGPFDASALTQAAFEMSQDKPLPDKPIQLGDEWVVYRLESRTGAKREEFTQAEREQVSGRLLDAKRMDVLASHVRRLKREAAEANQLSINEEIIASLGESGE